MEVGFIGLGQMGAAMAGQLIAHSHDVIIWNRDGSKAEALVAAGARPASSPAEAARCGVVVSMLANDEALAAVAQAPDGILSAGENILHISCSTVSVALTDRLTVRHSDRGQSFVSAQVLGRPDVAQAGALSVIAAGATNDLDRCAPIFEAVGQKIIRVGAEPGMAAAAKLAANVSIAAIIEMVTEAYAIAGARGVVPEAMFDLLTETNFGSRMIGVYGKAIVEGIFEPAGFPMRLGRKDVLLGLEAGGSDAPLPVARLIADRMGRAIDAGAGERDWASLGQSY